MMETKEDKIKRIEEVFNWPGSVEEWVKARYMQHPFNKKLGLWEGYQNGDLQHS